MAKKVKVASLVSLQDMLGEKPTVATPIVWCRTGILGEAPGNLVGLHQQVQASARNI
jgi:hypothetical protein